MAASAQPSYAYNEEAMLSGIASFKKEIRETRDAKLIAVRERNQELRRKIEAERMRRELLQAEHESKLLEKALAQEVAITQERLRQSQAITPDKIFSLVAEVFDVPLAAIVGESRQYHVAEARHALAYTLHRHLGWTVCRIGKLMGRHHTSVLHSLQTISAHKLSRPRFAERMSELDAAIPVVMLGR